ncbi:hypothetical protein [Paracoccus sp. IB05]|uniref:hypothetical protein n=1 Tax=Paracoccus sp. IB05 TaxID=2779367 RepID=UPI0018E767A5|nr:hypothetical protein [Paracoccus sp. IB05]MBJ2151572.1 hypothetical protein [Paracoccus sp. IB05]
MITDDEFSQAILEIDEALRNEDAPITGRPLGAIVRLGQRFKISLPFAAPMPGHQMPPGVAEN